MSNSSPTSRIARQTGVVAIMLVVVVSMAAPAGAAASLAAEPPKKSTELVSTTTSALQQTTNNTTYFDDFEDGDMEGWSDSDGVASVSQTSFYGSESLVVNDGGPSGSTWTDGPSFSTQDSFEYTGTFKYDLASSDNSLRFGIIERDHYGTSEPAKYAVALIDGGGVRDNISLRSGDGNTTSTSNASISHNQNTWLNFRYQFGGGEMRLKIWEAGTTEPTDWQIVHEAPEGVNGQFQIISGGSSAGQQFHLDEIDAGASAVTGRVVDEDGNPVANATVEAYGVNYDSLNDTIENKRERANKLLNQAENPFPDAWNPDRALTGSEGLFETSESAVVAVHTTNDWKLGGGQLPGTAYEMNVDPELGDPVLVAPNDEKLILSIWNPQNSGGIVLNREDSADSDLPGRTTGGTVVIEQISPAGEVVNEMSVETEAYVTLNPSFSFDTKTHEAASVDLPNNQFYRVYPEGNESAAYVIARGEPEQIGKALAQEMRTKAGNLTEGAKTLQERINSGAFRRTTTTTNESGHYEIRTLRGVEIASVQAYRADGTLLTNMTAPSVDDLRAAHERGYNGSVWISAGPERVEVPSSGNTIEVIKSPTPPFADMSDYRDILDRLRNEMLNESRAQLESMFEGQLNETRLGELQARHEQLRRLVENNEQLENQVQRLLNRGVSDGNVSRNQTIAELKAMSRAIADVEERLETLEPDTDIEEGELHGAFPFASDLNPDAISVVAHYQNGTSQTIAQDYWQVESASILGGDQVVVSGYPIPADAAVASIEVTGVSQDGQLGSIRDSIVNPAFSGNVPDVEAIDINTLRPGVGETVNIVVRSDDTAFGSLQDVTVYGPDGNEINATTNNGKAAFEPATTGVHSVHVTYSNKGGTAFTETFSIRAKEQPTSDPPTLRIVEGVDGPIPLAGDQLESASVTVDGKTATVTAQAPGGDAPSQIDVRSQTLTVDTIDLSVVHGSDRQAVNRHVTVRLYTDFAPGEAIIYRGDPSAPITKAGSTRYGAWETRTSERGDTHRIVETYTDANGQVTIDTSRNPGWWEQIVYDISTQSPIDLPLFIFDLPTLPSGAVGTLASNMMSGPLLGDQITIESVAPTAAPAATGVIG